jgi:uncharacterized protein (TIGR02145 family)
MTKSGGHIIKLVSISFLVILFVRCDKPENKSVNNPVNNPCSTSIMQWNVFCLASSPLSGAMVSPTKLVIRWIGHANSIFSLYFGTIKDNLPCISQQSTTSFIINNLDLNTTYYWNVMGVTPCHSGCSTGISSFTTVPDTNLPYIITAPVFTHVNTPPRVGGNILYEGSSKLSECGIYFGLSPNPDIGGTKFQIGDESGLFSDLLSGLNSSTTYYVKAYATNSSGTVFGPEVTFTTGQVSDYKSIRDLDENKYYIVNIGNQVWMAENLRTTKFNDGMIIPNITDDFNWETISTPAYCWYNNNPGFKTSYGALYNWYTIDTASNGHRNVCPSGWHIPSDAEWITLITNLGGDAGAGIKLKEAGDFYWFHTNNMGDNSSDFSALAGGQRWEQPVSHFDGTSSSFDYIRDIAAWWSNTSSINNLWVEVWLEVTSDKSSADQYPSSKHGGHSIRCIKDSK